MQLKCGLGHLFRPSCRLLRRHRPRAARL